MLDELERENVSLRARLLTLEQALQQFYDTTTWMVSECPTGRTDEGARQEYHDAFKALTDLRAEARNTDLVTHDESWWHKSRKAALAASRGREPQAQCEHSWVVDWNRHEAVGRICTKCGGREPERT